MPPRRGAAESKAAKQKKILLVLAPILVLLLAYQGRGLLTGGNSDAAKPAEPATTATTEAPGEQGGTSTAPVPAATLPDTEAPPPADPEQLASFDRFVPKDPFEQEVSAEASGDGGGASEAAAQEEPSPSDGGDGGLVPSAATGAAATSTDGAAASSTTGAAATSTRGATAEPAARSGDDSPSVTLTVNGSVERVAVGEAFPTGDPVFRVASVTPTTARIGLVSGSFSNGRKVELEIGERVTLVSQPDGGRYRLKLVALA